MQPPLVLFWLNAPEWISVVSGTGCGRPPSSDLGSRGKSLRWVFSLLQQGLLSPRQLPLQVTLPTLPSLLCPVLTSRPHSLLLEGDGTDWSKSFFVLLALGMGTGGLP